MRKKYVLPLILICLAGLPCSKVGENPPGGRAQGEAYVQAWTRFYPSRAHNAGMGALIFAFEDYSDDTVRKWIGLNREILETFEARGSSLPAEERIDARLLCGQARSELQRWEEEAPHHNSPRLYASALASGVNRIIRSPDLMPGEKFRLLRARLSEMRRMCGAARAQLKDGSPADCQRAVRLLERCGEDCAALPERLSALIPPEEAQEFAADCRDASGDLRGLAVWIQDEILPRASLSESPILGPDRYARLLRIYTDSDLTPDRLGELALEEIETVRRLMDELSSGYLKQVDPGRPLPAEFEARVGLALADMEANRPRTEAEYLERLRAFAADAERFVRERDLASLPEHQTLTLELAPESSGAMARIGYVSPPPAFHPNPWTTWHLATIPDSHPPDEREDFWRSFNYHFKRFIVIHELFPGHYLQGKIARENPHPVRVLFPYGPYSEGWATLCERVALDEGWAEGDPLTRLAQLRKRLENANRAYASVQVHCRGWDEAELLEFSVGTSLLAPQFAKSLWGRLMDSPLQMTSYFLGYRMFSEVYEGEKRRLGDRFEIRRFMDTILRAGPIPIDEFPEIMRGFKD